jgi:hypothetical protein
MEPLAGWQGVENLPFFSAIRESHYLYPVLLSTHLATLGLFGGLILVTNLRLLGFALVEMPIATLLDRLRRWKYLGLAVMVTTGALIAGSKASEYLANPYFQAKLAVLTLVGIHGVMFRAAVYRNPSLVQHGSLTRIVGMLSLVLWIAVLSLGRWIAYFE